jgi:glycosyltransferase involved in cell wall biosynthesis
MPVVSVVMAVHNNVTTVERAVDSILTQTIDDLEFVIVNDGANDGSAEVLRRKACEDGRIVLIEQENQGLTRSLIRGVGEARALYIARQDADDESAPQRLAAQLAFVPAHDIVAARSRREDGRPRPSVPVALGWRYVFPFRNPFYHGTLLFKKSLYTSAGGYDPSFRYAQDYDLLARMVTCAGARLKYCLEPLYRTSSGPQSISVAKRAEQEVCAARVRARLCLGFKGVVPA